MNEPAVASTVFVVDDDDAVRKTIRLLLESVQIPVEVFGGAEEFLAAYQRGRPGCLVADVRMPGMSGLELQDTLRARGIELPVIILTGHADVPMSVRALQHGAVDFIEKPYREQVLLDSIESALRRDREQRQISNRRDDIQERYDLLTPREREVLERVVAGDTTKQIAASFQISTQAIDAHRAKIMRKMQVTSVAELVRLVMTIDQA